MNKKLLAVAVAGVLAAPTAFAQSSVTISGLFKGGLESLKYRNFNPANGRGATVSGSGTTGIVDDSSRIVFNVVEDLGGGLQAIGQFDLRLKLDDVSGTAANNATGMTPGGNTHVGLRSKNWGRIFIGRQDLHYFNTESNITDKASLRLTPFSLLSTAGAFNVPGASVAAFASAIAGTTRTGNVIHYTTPNWSGFTLIAAYSSNGAQAGANVGPAAEADLASSTRKGSAWNLQPNFAGKNWQIGYSYWRSKPDLGAATTAAAAGNLLDQRGDRLYGSYTWGGFKLGLAWDKSKLKTPVAVTIAGLGALAAGTTTSDRTGFSIPMSYSWGAHEVHGHYTRMRNDKSTFASGLDTKSRMWSVAYVYNLSKRTSAAIEYGAINNGNNAAYTFFTNGSLGVANSAVVAGEDPRLWGVTLRHAF